MIHSINSRTTTLTQGNSSKINNIANLPEKDVAQYIADMVLELRNLAKAFEYKTLQGLLEVTYYEAFGMAHKVDIPEGEEQRLNDMGQDAARAATAF